MLHRGLFEEVTNMMLNGQINSTSMVAKAIGYRQTIKYLCNPDRREGDVQLLINFIK
jgi:tRNA A37 N6-isopentenylltransferase MiaA